MPTSMYICVSDRDQERKSNGTKQMGGEKKLYISITLAIHGFSIFLRQETHCAHPLCRRMHESWVSNFSMRWLRNTFFPWSVFLLRMTVILNGINKNLSQTNHNNNQLFFFTFFHFVYVHKSKGYFSIGNTTQLILVRLMSTQKDQKLIIVSKSRLHFKQEKITTSKYHRITIVVFWALESNF